LYTIQTRFGTKKTKGPKQDRQNQLGPPMPEGGESDKTLFVYVFIVGKIKTLDHCGLVLV